MTGNTVAFTKLYLALINDGLCLANSDMSYTLDRVLFDVFSAQLKHISASLKSEKLSQEVNITLQIHLKGCVWHYTSLTLLVSLITVHFYVISDSDIRPVLRC